jgi:long-chain fatty acid transport protein
MKKCMVFAALILFTFPLVHASIITNTNQSAIFLRLLARGASTQIDAVYYNPAGLTQLENGFHFSIHNQSIYQEKIVNNGFPFLNDPEYVGDVDVPVFPSVFMAYKKDKLALSFGFGINGGGGTADFKTGLPSFETSISSLPALIYGFGIPTTAYSVDIAFEGKSIFYGVQFNVSYAVSDAVAVAGGFRYIIAENVYEGSIANIMVNPAHPLINPTAQMMSAVQFFTVAGLPQYAAMVADKNVDVKQSGTGFTPILSLHLRPIDTLHIGIRYEFNTALELENATTQDDTGLFPDGFKFRNDIPAILAFGLEYSVLPQLRAHVSASYYFDKSADWDGSEDLVDSNTYDFAIGLEYDVSDSFLLSAGYLRTQIGVDDEYQSDLSHELSSNTYGCGGRLTLMEKLDIDLGVFMVDYQDAERNIQYLIGSFAEKYSRTTWGVAFGLGYRF